MEAEAAGIDISHWSAPMVGPINHKSAACRIRVPDSVPMDMRRGLREVTHVVANQPGKGHGTGLMKKVCDTADTHRLVLMLQPATKELEDWYARFGFVILQEEPKTIMVRQNKAVHG